MLYCHCCTFHSLCCTHKHTPYLSHTYTHKHTHTHTQTNKHTNRLKQISAALDALDNPSLQEEQGKNKQPQQQSSKSTHNKKQSTHNYKQNPTHNDKQLSLHAQRKALLTQKHQLKKQLQTTRDAERAHKQQRRMEVLQWAEVVVSTLVSVGTTLGAIQQQHGGGGEGHGGVCFDALVVDEAAQVCGDALFMLNNINDVSKKKNTPPPQRHWNQRRSSPSPFSTPGPPWCLWGTPSSCRPPC